MHQFFHAHRELIEQELKNYLENKNRELASVGKWGDDLIKRLSAFSTQGKMIRGGLIILSYLMFNKRYTESVIKTAAAIEIIHSSLLIHDDIMDRDNMRRGKKSIFYQYKKLGDAENTNDSYHFGVSLGICAGDIGYYLGIEILSALKIDPEIKGRIISLWTRELEAVGVAQMHDIALGFFSAQPCEEDILNLYRFKTARYTFSLPLATGALLAGQNSEVIRPLEQLGENLGIIFQIKDDEIGIFGNKEETGKPVGTDIKEGKKTLYSHYLKEALDKELAASGGGTRWVLTKEERERLKGMLAGGEMNQDTMLSLRIIAEKSGVKEKITQKVGELRRKAEQQIASLCVDNEYKNILLDILESSMKRKR